MYLKNKPPNQLRIIDYVRFYLPFKSQRKFVSVERVNCNLVLEAHKTKTSFRPQSVCVVIPTRDKLDLLIQCLDSLELSNPGLNLEILIVDNGSVQEETSRYFESLTSSNRAQVVSYPGAFNFSELCNFASRLTSAEYLCFVNNDVRFDSTDSLAKLLMHFQNDQKVGLVGSLLHYPDGSIQHAGVVLGIGKLASHLFAGEGSEALIALPCCYQVSAVTFALAMTPRKLFERLGGLDGQFKVGLNDIDFGVRVRDAGYKVFLCGENKVFHVESASRGQRFNLRTGTRAIIEVTRFLKKHQHLTKDSFFRAE